MARVLLIQGCNWETTKISPHCCSTNARAGREVFFARKHGALSCILAFHFSSICATIDLQYAAHFEAQWAQNPVLVLDAVFSHLFEMTLFAINGASFIKLNIRPPHSVRLVPYPESAKNKQPCNPQIYFQYLFCKEQCEQLPLNSSAVLAFLLKLNII